MGSIDRRPAAENDLVEIWVYIARVNERAADQALDRIELALRILADNPQIGRPRPELAPVLRSLVVGSRVAFHRPTEKGVDLVRVLGGAMDIGADDVQ